MRKALIHFIILCLLAISLPTLNNAAESEIVDDFLIQKSLDEANNFLKIKLLLEKDYYLRNKNNKDLIKNMAISGGKAFFNKPVFAYGDKFSASKEATSSSGNEYAIVDGIKEYRAIGYAADASIFPNPNYPSGVDNQGYKATDKKWVKEPWFLDIKTKKLYGEDGKQYTIRMGAGIKEYISNWIKSNIFRPDKVEGITGQHNFFTVTAYDENVPAALKNDFEDFLYIIQPPTEHSYGLGIAFYYWDGYSRLNYRTFLLKSFDLLEKDLSADFITIPSSVNKDDDVLVRVDVNSTFDTDLKDVAYKWEITKADGTPLKPSASKEQLNDKLEFAGSTNAQTGNLNITKDKKTMLYAGFVMPNSGVRIKFEINKDGANPKETALDNNVIEKTIKVIQPINTTGDIELDYNVLAKEVKFPMVNGADIVAQLVAPMGNLTGNAWGSLNVDNKTPELYQDLKATDTNITESTAPKPNEPPGKITKHPEISTIIHRKDATKESDDIYDDPAGRRWLPGPSTRISNGIVTFGGTAHASYHYYCNGCVTNEDGSKSCPVGHYDKTKAPFNNGTDKKVITTKIYNGKPAITPKKYETRIENNAAGSRKLLWTSEPYGIKVIRWMFHQNENGSLDNRIEVPGQYDRIFTQQDKADIKWSIGVNLQKKPGSMANEYKQSREAARYGNYEKSVYDKAVFASDIGFKNVDYPIKSGYYFNPTGTYTFTLTTETYKQTKVETKDHEDLVDAVINAFRYETDLMYTNNRGEPVNIQNRSLSKSGSFYARRPGALTAQDPAGVDGMVLLNVKKSKVPIKVEELEHSQETDEQLTDNRWKAILEGYGESGTIGSKDNYKYREYIRNDQKMYKITETTTVTIEINPNNRKVYTFAHMPDGKYYVKAWFDDIHLDKTNHEYKKLGTLKGMESLDRIEVSVKGSMYDDLIANGN